MPRTTDLPGLRRATLTLHINQTTHPILLYSSWRTYLLMYKTWQTPFRYVGVHFFLFLLKRKISFFKKKIGYGPLTPQSNSITIAALCTFL